MLPVVVVTRLLFVLVTLLVGPWRVFAGLKPLFLYAATGTPLDNWNRWDVRWYDDLAWLGYNARGPDGFANLAFFPLYPLLTRALHDGIAIVGRDVMDFAQADHYWPPYLVAGMIVANLCAVAALCFFYVFVRLDHGRPAARRAVILLGLSPMSLFLFAAYSEATFLLCAIAFFYTLRLERWWQAGMWGLLAAATRPPGAVLLVPFLMAWAEAHPVVAGSAAARARLLARTLSARIRQARARRNPHVPAPRASAVRVAPAPLAFRSRSSDGRTPRRRAGDVGVMDGHAGARASRAESVRPWLHPRSWPPEVRHALRNAVPAVAIPLGLILFMIFLGRVFHDPWAFSHIQVAWWRTFAPPWETLVISVAWPLGDVLAGKVTVVDLFALHDLCYEVIGLALTWLAWKRLPRVQGIYLWLLWITILSSPAMLIEHRTHEPHHDVLMSLPRLLLMMFPLYTVLALHRRLFVPLTVVFAALVAVYTGMFLTGGWIS